MVWLPYLPGITLFSKGKKSETPQENARLTHKDTPGNPKIGQEESLSIPEMLVTLPEENLNVSDLFPFFFTPSLVFHIYTKFSRP